MKFLVDFFKRRLQSRLSFLPTPQLALEGGFIYRVRIIGHMSLLMRFCIEDILLETADEMGTAISFVEQGPCDLCVVCGDAFLGSGMTKYYHLLKKVSAPLFSFGIGSEGSLGNIGALGRQRLKKTLRRMTAVSVRNKIVAAQIRRLSGREDVTVIGDPLFSLKPLRIKENRSVRKIGIAPIDWRAAAGEAETLYQSIVRYCNVCLRDHSVEIHIFCFSRGESNDDETIAQNIRRNISDRNRVFIHPYIPDVLLSYSRIQVVDYLISMRSTAAVAALLYRKPFVVMEKRGSRGEEIFGLLGCEDLLISSRQIMSGYLDERLKEMENTSYRRLSEAFLSVKQWKQKQRMFASSMLSKINKMHPIA